MAQEGKGAWCACVVNTCVVWAGSLVSSSTGLAFLFILFRVALSASFLMDVVRSSSCCSMLGTVSLYLSTMSLWA